MDLTAKWRKMGWVDRIAVIAIIGMALFIGSWAVMVFGSYGINEYRARNLAASLRDRYPKLQCHGNATGERGWLIIGVQGAVDPATQRDIMDWLAEQKEKRRLGNVIELFVRSDLRFERFRLDDSKNQGWLKIDE